MALSPLSLSTNSLNSLRKAPIRPVDRRWQYNKRGINVHWHCNCSKVIMAQATHATSDFTSSFPASSLLSNAATTMTACSGDLLDLPAMRDQRGQGFQEPGNPAQRHAQALPGHAQARARKYLRIQICGRGTKQASRSACASCRISFFFRLAPARRHGVVSRTCAHDREFQWLASRVLPFCAPQSIPLS